MASGYHRPMPIKGQPVPWARITAEGAAIVVSILLAFAIDAAWQHRGEVAEERETVRKDARRRGAAVIIDQIQEREVERIKQREQLQKEQEQMNRQIEQ